MLEPNSFDKAIRAANKLDAILTRMEKRDGLRGLSNQLTALKDQDDQVRRIIDRNRLLLNITNQLALRNAGINRRTLDRVGYYDKELAAVRRVTAAQTRAQAVEQSKITQLAARKRAAADAAEASINAELNRRKDVIRDLTDEYNLRMSMSGFDVAAVKVADDIAVNNGRILALQERLRDVEADRAKIQDRSSERLDEINAQLAKQQMLEEAINKQKDADRKIFKAQAKTEGLDFFKNKFGGGIIGQLGQVAKNLGKIGLLLGPLAIIALIIKSLVGKYVESLQATIDLGLDASQRISEIAKATRIAGKAISENGILLDPEELIKINAALSDTFGKLDIPEALVQRSAEISRLWNVSAEDAAKLAEYFVRINGNSTQLATQQLTTLGAIAKLNNVNPNKLIKDVASNAANFAKSSRASADELGRAAIYVNRLGTSLSTVSNVADRLVSDFEGALESQATISAFNPNFDQTGLLVASQFGTDADIARELKAAVDSLGGNIDDLPRAQKLAYAQSLGVGVDELIKIANSEDGDISKILSPGEQAIVDATKGVTNEIQQGIANPMASVERILTSGFGWLINRFGDTKDKVAAMSGKQLGEAALTKNDPYLRMPFSEKQSYVAQQKIKADGLQIGLEQYQNTLKTTDPTDKARINFLTTEIARIQEAMGKPKADVSTPITATQLRTPSKIPSFDVGGIIGGEDRKSFKSINGLFGKLKSNELPAILHKGEAVLNKTQMNVLDQLTNVQASVGNSITGFIDTFTKKFSSKDGIMGKVSNLLNVGKSGRSGGLLESITKTIGGQGNNKITNLMGDVKTRVTGLFTGGLKDKAAGLLGKIPSIGGLASNLLKGGGIKNIAGNLLKGGAGKLIGGAIGSIIPGAGTMVGSLLGGGASKLIGGLVNSKIGKSITGLVTKSPIGKLAGKALGGIGKKLGGLFGRKKKPTVTNIQTDYSQQAGMSGLLNYGGQLTPSYYQSGINIPNVPGMMSPQQMNQSSSPIGNTQALEAKFDTLINLLKSGAIGVNIDGKKVSNSLVDANRYG